MKQNWFKFEKNEWFVILAVAFGYFTDLYDLLVFSSVRIQSLKDLGIYDPKISGDLGTQLLNYTVIGMLIGGFFWGILADKLKKRNSILFYTIITYSVANILNAFVYDIESYKLFRLISGIGLAGELGAGMTLIYEILNKYHNDSNEVGKLRTQAAMIVSAFGMLGAVTAGFVGLFAVLNKNILVMGLEIWRIAFLVGGVLGILLFTIRYKILESDLIEKSNNRGNLMLLFVKQKDNNQIGIVRYLLSIIVGLPIFFMIGILVGRANDFASIAQVKTNTSYAPSIAIMLTYISISFFDIIAGRISIFFKSYKKTLKIFIAFQFFAVSMFLYVPVLGVIDYYFRYVLIGASIGVWTIVIINATAQFGTNLRATIATSVPNIIRFLLWPLTIFIFDPLKNSNFFFTKSQNTLIDSAAVVLYPSIIIAFWAVSNLKEKYGVNADYNEKSYK